MQSCSLKKFGMYGKNLGDTIIFEKLYVSDRLGYNVTFIEWNEDIGIGPVILLLGFLKACGEFQFAINHTSFVDIKV